MTPLSTAAVFREKTPDPHFGEAVPAESGALLTARIKDLRLHLSGTVLEKYIQQLYAELEAKGIALKPECYLSDQWGCPNGVPVIGIPFYLADQKLQSIEASLGSGVESEREILMYLRHEAGHAFNYAYKLYETEDWRKVFGDYSRPYREDFKPQPFSRKYVVHMSGWYAQKHPDEDFAETFAVWLTPGSDWEKKYKGWGALKKLQAVQAAVESLGQKPPLVTLRERDLDVDEMEETVLEHYQARDLEEKVDLQLGEHLDQDLTHLFEGPLLGGVRADTLVRAERQHLIQAVTQYSGVSRSVVRSVLDHLTERVAALGLTVHREQAKEYMTRLTSLVTALAMNYLYTDRFFEVD
ncbi:MAG: putative zinc-binding metallopeptidase [Myxococcaceae bacterium]|nr:putative zinc-binding metallopeptidase [Myxococcaceae bacterium]